MPAVTLRTLGDRSTSSNIELVARLTMVTILLTAGVSKFFSHGGFFDYYYGLFQGDLRISLPTWLVATYLYAIPFIEVGLGLALTTARFKPYSVYTWHCFFITLLFGHYVLQEWSSVNQMLDYIFLGLICQALPARQRTKARLQRERR